MSPKILTICKDRLPQLQEALATWRQFTSDITVLDYGCPQGTFDFCRENNITAVKVLDVDGYFNLSHARNIVVRFAERNSRENIPPLFVFDCDRALRQNFHFDGYERRIIIYGAKNCPELGSCRVDLPTWRHLRGWDESFLGYGLDDIDFYARCRISFGAQSVEQRIVDDTWWCVPHGDHAKWYRINDKDAGIESNRKIMEENLRGRAVNPHGFGEARCLLYQAVP